MKNWCYWFQYAISNGVFDELTSLGFKNPVLVNRLFCGASANKMERKKPSAPYYSMGDFYCWCLKPLRVNMSTFLLVFVMGLVSSWEGSIFWNFFCEFILRKEAGISEDLLTDLFKHSGRKIFASTNSLNIFYAKKNVFPLLTQVFTVISRQRLISWLCS